MDFYYGPAPSTPLQGTNIVIAGNYFGVAVDGVTRFTNSTVLMNSFNGAGGTARFGSDFDGVSDGGEAEGRARRGWYLLGALSAGLATLVKGPIGFLIPALVLLVFNRVEGRRGAWKRLFAPLNLLVFFGISLPAFRIAGGLKHDQLQYSLSASHLNVSGGTGGIENVRNTGGQGSLLYRPDSRTTISARLFASEAMTGVNASPYAAPDSNLPATGIVQAIALPGSQIALGDAGQPFNWGNATFAPNLSDPDNRADSSLTSTMLSAQRIVTPSLTLHVSWQSFLGDRNNTNGPAGAGLPRRLHAQRRGGRLLRAVRDCPGFSPLPRDGLEFAARARS